MGYIRKVSVHLRFFFPHMISVLIIFLAANGERMSLMKTISKQDSVEIETRQCYYK